MNGVAISFPSDLSKPYAIIDTGTTEIIFNTQANYDALVEVLKNSNIINWDPSVTNDMKNTFWEGDEVLTSTSTVNSNTKVTIEFLGDNNNIISVPIPIDNFISRLSVNQIVFQVFFSFSFF